jgi:G3E family GTPase
MTHPRASGCSVHTDIQQQYLLLCNCRYGSEVPDGDDRTISNLLLDQIEFADVLLLNKVDLLQDCAGIGGQARIGRLEEVLHELNPRARVLRTTRCDVDLPSVLLTGLFDIDQVRARAHTHTHTQTHTHTHTHPDVLTHPPSRLELMRQQHTHLMHSLLLQWTDCIVSAIIDTSLPLQSPPSHLHHTAAHPPHFVCMYVPGFTGTRLAGAAPCRF